MGSIIDYIRWRGDIPFSVIPPGEVDELIFSHLAYQDFSDVIKDQPITLHRAYEVWKEKGCSCPPGVHNIFIWDEIVPMFLLLSEAPRYRDCLLSDFECTCDRQTESQFAALSLIIPGIADKHILFRGTDDTLIGWKENLNMSFLTAIPAQILALNYLCKHGKGTHLILNGHSKGGNLAVFAAATSPVNIQENIRCVWNFDGPGFRHEFFRTSGYQSIRGRIRMYVPESSVFGMMLINDGRYRVIRSNRTGVAQHDGFSWEVNGQSFCYAPKISQNSLLINRIMNRWLSGIPGDRRKELIECVFRMLEAEQFESMSEVKAKQNRKRVLHAYLKADRVSKRLLLTSLFPLFRLWKSVKYTQEKSAAQRHDNRIPLRSGRRKTAGP